jgi:hypothetical protein
MQNLVFGSKRMGKFLLEFYPDLWYKERAVFGGY